MSSLERPDQILVAEFDGESVLLDTRSGQYFAVNDTALMIWRLAREGRLKDSIATAVAATFNVPREMACADVQSFCAELTRAGLLRT